MDLDDIKVIYQKKGFYTKYIFEKFDFTHTISKEKFHIQFLNFCPLYLDISITKKITAKKNYCLFLT